MSLTLRQVTARPESLVVGDDPVGEIAAIRTAGDAEGLGIGQAVRDEGVHAAEDVAHRAGAPVAVVGLVERPAVALGAARIGVQDADPAGGEDLELPHRRPAVQGVRTAVDLGHERLPALAGRDEPALDLAAIDAPAALGGLSELQVGQDVRIELGQTAGWAGFGRAGPGALGPGGGPGRLGSRGHLEDMDVRRLGRARTQEGDPAAAAAQRNLVERRDVVATAGQSFQPPIAGGDAPELVAAVDEGREGDPRPSRGKRPGAGLAHRDVAGHPQAGQHAPCWPEDAAPAVAAGVAAAAANSQMSLR